MNNSQTKGDDTVAISENKATASPSTFSFMPGINTTADAPSRLVLDTSHETHPKLEQRHKLQQQQTLTKQSNIQSWSIFFESLKKLFSNEFFSDRHSIRAHRTTASIAVCDRVPPRILLHGCKTSKEHFDRIQEILSTCKNLSGLKGLQSIGFTYRKCQETCLHDDTNGESTMAPRGKDSEGSNHKTECSQWGETRLLHISTDTFITKQNREMYIADGEMYEEVVRMCQEYAQDLMMEEASLHWVSVCEEKEKGNPIRVLVDKNYPLHSRGKGRGEVSLSPEAETEATSHDDCCHVGEDLGADANEGICCDRETLIITTGKGKVRAGIFSRQHLLVSSIEASTALPMVRDAKRRNMSIAILDPNARGDRYGMATYQQSMEVLFGSHSESAQMTSSMDTKDIQTSKSVSTTTNGNLYILAHSASGSQLARYLLLTADGGHQFFSRIKSIAFTDSNHSIQWLKTHSHISSFFQSSATLYVRSSIQWRDDGWERHKCGDIVDTSRDENWLHRFGNVPTIWAGTTDHSLTNYTSHSFIWEHFDKCRCGKDEDTDE